MPFPYRSYSAGLRLLRGISPLFARGDSKLARGLHARRSAVDHLVRADIPADRSADHPAGRSTDRSTVRSGRKAPSPLAWFHAPSVGEGLQARAVIERLQAECPAARFAYTHFSPSAEGLAARMPVDVAGYLPWDTRRDIRRTLDALSPRLVAFTKTEVWPVLAREAALRGAGVVLVAATLPPGAGRLRPAARPFMRPVFGALDRVFAISDDDAGRFELLGVDPSRIVVTGDPAIDSAHQRAKAADSRAPFLQPFHASGRPVLVAGSTWAPDEAVLVPAATETRRHVPDLLLLIAPHEPSPAHLERLERDLAGAGWSSARLSAVEDRGEIAGVGAVLVDRVGVLAHLYTAGAVAFVGGGFHRHGLHSVLEPAAAGLPVVFGPGHRNARSAGELIEEGGAREVAGVPELSRALTDWLEAGGEADAAGTRARGYILKHEGAALRTARELAPFLEVGTPRRGDRPNP